KGLEYLVNNQRPDGHWEAADGSNPVTTTGLVGIALVMDRERREFSGFVDRNARKPTHLAQIRKAADWLLAQRSADRDGLFFSEHESERPRYMQGHGLATIFLSGVLEEETDPDRRKKLGDALTHAVKYIASAQSSQGGW